MFIPQVIGRNSGIVRMSQEHVACRRSRRQSVQHMRWEPNGFINSVKPLTKSTVKHESSEDKRKLWLSLSEMTDNTLFGLTHFSNHKPDEHHGQIKAFDVLR